MQSRIPRQSPRDPGLPGPVTDAWLSAELAAVVAGARRRALRDGDRQIDTAHLLHSLLEYDADVRALFDAGPRLARLLGYLVQRSIGYGLRWQSSVEDSGAAPALGGGQEGEGYSPLAAAALGRAWERAARRGEERAGGVDLLAVIVAEPRARAVEVLARAGWDAAELLTLIESLPAEGEGRSGRLDDLPEY